MLNNFCWRIIFNKILTLKVNGFHYNLILNVSINLALLKQFQENKTIMDVFFFFFHFYYIEYIYSLLKKIKYFIFIK
jgi:hypothetical protein